MDAARCNDQYIAGRPWGLCDRCAFQYRLDTLKTEWTGLKVCETCWDPRPTDMDPPRIYPEGLPVRGARPDPGDTLGPNLTSREDL